MAVPKRKTSKSKKRMRKNSSTHQRPAVSPAACPECGAARIPHRVCPSCGMYKGRQVLTMDAEA
jgi:large subunit ribosomal protein L32